MTSCLLRIGVERSHELVVEVDKRSLADGGQSPSGLAKESIGNLYLAGVTDAISTADCGKSRTTGVGCGFWSQHAEQFHRSVTRGPEEPQISLLTTAGLLYGEKLAEARRGSGVVRFTADSFSVDCGRVGLRCARRLPSDIDGGGYDDGSPHG